MKRIALLLLLLGSAACSHTTPYATTVGILHPGATIAVSVAQGTFNAYQPEVGKPRDRFTVEATALPKTLPAPPKLRSSGRGIEVTAPDPLASLLVRVPDGVDLAVDSRSGDVHVSDVGGNVDVKAARGSVKIFLRDHYAQAAVGVGGLSVTMGAASWPGTLHFSTGSGDVEVWISERAACTVHLHTDDGTLFTDFDLRGHSQGNSETIDGALNGGSATQALDIETKAGAIRLLRLHPEA